MIFGQLSNRESLRDLIVALEAHQPKCYHMGIGLLVGQVPKTERRREGPFPYDLETSVPAFFRTTKASVHDSRGMCEIPYETGSYYVFDRGYNAFKELFKIHKRDSFFIVRAKKNLQYNCTT